MIKFVGFDKDGTLFDSMGSYARIWGEIFNKEYGINEKNAADFLLNNAGQPTIIQVFNILKQNGILISKQQAFDKSVEIAETLGKRVKANLFPDVPAALKKLKEQGYKIFVSSGQQEDIVKRDLIESGLIEYVDFYAGIRQNDPKFTKGKAHFIAAAKYFGLTFKVFVSETVFIGDTETDMEVAFKNNIPCIIRSNTNLKVEGPNFTVNNFSNLEKIIRKIN